MARRLGLFLAMVLVIVQVLSIWHMAEHAFCKHEHNGRACDIALSFDKSKTLGNHNAKPLPELAFFILKNIPVNDIEADAILYTSSHPRAPPVMTLA